MKKAWGFYATRKRESRRRPRSPALLWLAALLGALLLIAGATRASSQSSGSSSSSSSDDLKTWEALSERFTRSLEEQSTQLRQALTETQTSKARAEKLTHLLEQSLKANDALRSYNAQIGERMQARDEELAKAYDVIDEAEKQNLRLIIALIIAIVAAAAATILFILLLVRR